MTADICDSKESEMLEMTREATHLEAVALAIQACTYGEMIEFGRRVRDVISDRMSDNPDALQDATEIAHILHSWASAELEPVQ